MIYYFLENADLKFERKSVGASGYDLMSNCDIELKPGERALCKTGLYLEMSIGTEAQVRSRSGLSVEYGVVVLNAPGTVDADYRGEVCANLINLGERPWRAKVGDRIAQIVFAQVAGVDAAAVIVSRSGPVRVYDRGKFSATVRGEGGHGSTGR